MVSPRDSRMSALPPPNTAELDAPLHTIGFQLDVLSAAEVNGYLRVTEFCCQPFKTLHGGVSALISEALARMGVQVASGSQQVTGVHLSINHHRSAAAGDLVFASGTTVEADEKAIQVWEVCLWKMNESIMKKEFLIASARVIISSNMSAHENAKEDVLAFRKHAKL